MRERLSEAQNHRCCYCGMIMNPPTLEHYQARCHGGQDVWENLVAACFGCNSSRKTQHPMKYWFARQQQIRASR